MTQKSVMRPDGSQVDYLDDGHGPLIVLIASTGRDASDFDPLTRALVARNYRVVAVQPRGLHPHSLPKDPEASLDFSSLAGEVALVIEAIGEVAIVAGHAYGNWIARTLAEDRPDLVRGVVLIAAGSRDWPKHLTAAIDALLDPVTPSDKRREALELAFFAPGNDPSEWMDGWYPEVAAIQRRARKNNATDDWRRGGTAPILDLLAELDPFRPSHTRDEYTKTLGDRVTMRAVAGASHALPCERPAEVAEQIDDWIKSSL